MGVLIPITGPWTSPLQDCNLLSIPPRVKSLPSLDEEAVCAATSPESIPDSLLPVVTVVRTEGPSFEWDVHLQSVIGTDYNNTDGNNPLLQDAQHVKLKLKSQLLTTNLYSCTRVLCRSFISKMLLHTGARTDAGQTDSCSSYRS